MTEHTIDPTEREIEAAEQKIREAEAAQNTSWTSTAGQVLSDIGTGIAETPRAVVKGVTGAVNEVSDMAFSAAQKMEEMVPLGSIEIGGPNGLISYSPHMPQKNDLTVFRETMAEPQSVTGNLIKDTTKFLTGFVGGMRLVKGAAGAATTVGGKIAQGAAAGAIADASVFDPNDDRLSNLIEQYPFLENPVSRYLAARPEDGEAEGRFKNALEGLLLGSVAEGIFLGAKALKALRSGDTATAEVLSEQADMVAQKLDTEATQMELPLDGGGTKPDSIHEQIRPKVDTPEGTKGPTDTAPKSAVTAPKAFMDETTVSRFRERLGYLEDNAGSNQRAWFNGDDLTEGLDFNFSSIDSEDGVRAAINSMSSVIDEHMVKLRGGNAEGVRSWDNVKANADRLADLVGERPEILMKRLQDQSVGMKHLDSTVLAYRTFLTSLSDRTFKLAQLVDNGVPGKYGSMANAEAELLRTAQLLGEVQAMYKGVQTNIARSLNAMKLPAGVNEDMLRNVAQLSEGGAPEIKKLAKRLAMTDGDPHMVNKLLRGGFMGKSWDAYTEYWINALLSSPKTHIVNVSSNIASSLMDPLERTLAGAMRLDKGAMMDGVMTYVGYMRTIKDTLELSGRALKLGENILDPVNYVSETGARHAISAQHFGISSGGVGTVVDGVGAFVRLPTRLMLATDEFTKQMVYRGNLYAVLTREGMEKGLKGPALSRFINDRFDDAFNPAGAAKNKELLQRAREVTFSQDLQEGTLGKSLQELTSSYPPLKLVIPFVRTPTNILRYVWQRTPGINLLQQQYRNDLLAGGARAASATSKMAVGGALWAYGFNLAMDGSITGNGPADPEVRRLKMETGWKPYSVRTVNPETGAVEYRQYNRADPFAMFLGLAADVAEIGGKLGEREFGELSAAMAVGLIHNLNNKSYLKGLMDVTQAMAAPDRNFERWWHSMAGSNVPAAVNAFKGGDYLREVRSTVDAIMARLPGHSQTLDPQRNFLGEKIETPVGWGLEDVSPVAFSSWKQDSVKDEVARLAELNKTAFKAPMKTWGEFDLTQFKVAPNQSAYDRLQELTGTIKLSGRTLKEALEEQITSPRWAQMTDGNEEYDGSRMTVIRSLIRGYRRYAEERLVEENKDLREHYFNHLQNMIDALKEQ